MLHAKFQDHRDSDYDKEVLKLFTIYGCGVHLGHATLGQKIPEKMPEILL